MSIETPDHACTPNLGPPRVRVAVVHRNQQNGLVALHGIAAGESFLAIEGVLSSTPCQYSVQVGPGTHIAPPENLAADDDDRYLWRFLNHSCDPNAAMVGRMLVAIKPIAAGEEITFDYNTTEYEMAAPFRCRCGHCDGSEIRGARFLSLPERQSRAHLLPEYLRDADDHSV